MEGLAGMRLVNLKRTRLWDLYKQGQRSYWIADEVNLAQDRQDWANTSPEAKEVLLKVLGFFATADGTVAENAALKFSVLFQNWPEAVAFYTYQSANEMVHMEMYHRALLEYTSPDLSMFEKYMSLAETSAFVRDKAAFARKWLDNEEAPAWLRLVAFASVEGVAFSSSFGVIFWFKKDGKLYGLVESNDFISRDEALHTRFPCAMLKQLEEEGDGFRILDHVEEIHKVIQEVYDIEARFVDALLPNPLPGLSADLMKQHVRHVVDHLCIRLLEIPPIFGGTQSPFTWMGLSKFDGKSNFFERHATEYQHAIDDDSGPLSLDETY
jgi:ribonucleoside-diphosphate reductase subunit M2